MATKKVSDDKTATQKSGEVKKVKAAKENVEATTAKALAGAKADDKVKKAAGAKADDKVKKPSVKAAGEKAASTANKATGEKAAKAVGEKAKKPSAKKAKKDDGAVIDNSRAVAMIEVLGKEIVKHRTQIAKEKSEALKTAQEKGISSGKAVEKEKKIVLFAASEAAPFAGTGGLGEVMGSLPRALAKEGIDARVILPLYESVMLSYREKMQFMGYIYVPLAWRSQYCGLFSLEHEGVTYYFIDNEYYFKRGNLYGYYDDGERFAYFSRAVLEVVPLLGFKPHIIAAQDWQAALVPIYYKLFYMYNEKYSDIKTVFTIHNIEYQGKFSKSILEEVFGINSIEFGSLEHHGGINLMRGALDYADYVTTVSPTYADEIKTPFYSHGLEFITQKNAHKLRGILNGIDTNVYNPKTNTALFKNYDAKTISDKAFNKTELQKMLSFKPDPNVPLLGMITRLVSHKGLDLVRMAIEEILRLDVQVVILGKGDHDYENYFSHLQNVSNNKMSCVIAFNRDLSHKIYAGSDMFLMPSKSEPCGLSQMMACRYGTVPIVRSTGGLRDSIADCGNGDIGNGFVFDEYSVDSMMHAIRRAAGLYRDYRSLWDGLVQRCMASDFSWQKSAKEYKKFFLEIIN